VKNGGEAAELAALEKRSDVASCLRAGVAGVPPPGQLVLPRRSAPLPPGWSGEEGENGGGLVAGLAEALELTGVRGASIGNRRFARKALQRRKTGLRETWLQLSGKEHRGILVSGPVGLHQFLLPAAALRPRLLREMLLVAANNAQAARGSVAQIGSDCPTSLSEVSGKLSTNRSAALSKASHS